MSPEDNLQREETIRGRIADSKKRFISNCEKRITISKTIDLGNLKKI